VSPKPYYPHIVRYYDEHAVVISDKYPKAKYHLLVMPAFEVYGFDCLTLDNVPMLEEMRDRGLALIDEIRNKEPELSFRMGFHAIPSLKQLHMHVISQDFDSPGLKTKKHWNSFNSDFFVDANLFINTLQTQGYVFLDKEYYETVMKEPMKCPKCGEEHKNIVKLKTHAASCGDENSQ
jgi:aprataxin